MSKHLSLEPDLNSQHIGTEKCQSQRQVQVIFKKQLKVKRSSGIEDIIKISKQIPSNYINID